MSMRIPGLLVASTMLFLSSPASTGQEGTSGHDARAEIEPLEVHLEDAVGRVSIPHAGILLGRASASRGYRLPGYGIVFVLTPRALPGDRPLFVVRREGPPGRIVRVERHVAHSGEEPHWVPETVEDLERQVLVLQHVAEAQRREAEEDMDRIVEDVRVRVEVRGHEAAAAEDHDVMVRVDTPGAEPPADAVSTPERPEPPWKFWFEGEASEEERTPDVVVADVRAAVIAALESAPVAGLGEDELVTVAVDFVSGDFFASHRRPTRTLIVRARQRDLAARAGGTLTPEEFRARVEVIEY